MIVVPSTIGVPSSLTFIISAPPLSFDLTTVTAVTFNLLRRDGTQVSLSGSVVSATPNSLTAQYTFAGGEITTTGLYEWAPVLTVPGGLLSCQAVPMFVSTPFSTTPQLESSSYLVSGSKILSAVPQKSVWQPAVTPSSSPYAAFAWGPWIPVDSRTGPVTVDLWKANDGDVVAIADVYDAAGTNSVTIVGYSGQNVPDAGTYGSSVTLSNSGFVAYWKYDAALGAWVSLSPTSAANVFVNDTITNLDNVFGHTPALVRYAFRPVPNALAGANETTAEYVRLGDDTVSGGPVNTQYAFYAEIPTGQNFTSGGAAIKIIHRGHGDGTYTALLNGITAQTITAMTGNGVNPIVCTVPSHGFGQQDPIEISGCLGNTAANGTWTATVIDANTFSIPTAGNGTYTASSGTAADTNPPIGYEGAQWGDGCTSFLASQQYPGGRPNATYFNALVQSDAILNYGCYVTTDTPNNSFVGTKRTGLADSTLDGQLQIVVRESSLRMTSGNGGVSGGYKGTWLAATAYTAGQTVTLGSAAYKCILGNTNQQPPNATYWTNVTDTANSGRNRHAVYNNGEVHQNSLLASSSTQLYDSPLLRLNGSYWTGSVGQERSAYFVHHLASTFPQSDFRLYMGNTGSESVCQIWDSASPLMYRIAQQGSANTQTGSEYDVVARVTTTNAGAAQVDTAYSPPSGHSATVRIKWNVKDTSTHNTAGGEMMAVIRNVSGTLTVAGAGAATSTFGDSAVNTSSVAFAASGGNTLICQGSPPGGYSGTLDWVFRCEIVEN